MAVLGTVVTMKSRDALQIGLKKIFRNKHNIILMILLLIFSILNLVSLMFLKNFTNYIDNVITNNIGFRSILVSLNFDKSDYGLADIKKHSHIINVYSSKYSFASVKSSFENEDFDGYLMLNYGDENILPHVTYGQGLNFEDSGVAICPERFYPSSEAYNLFINEKKIISGSNILDDEFLIKYYSYKFDGNRFIEDKEYQKKFKIIGLYDSINESVPANTCYISGKDVKEIVDVVRSSDSSSEYGFVAVVDKNSNVNKVLKELIDDGFTGSSIQMQMDTSITGKIILANKIISIFLIICNIIISVLYIKKKLVNEEKLQGVLISEGYNIKDINKLYLFEVGTLSFLSLITSCIIFNLIFYIVKNTVFKSLILSGFSLYNFKLPYFVSFLNIFIIPILITIILIILQYKKNIISLIVEDE